MDMNQAEKVKKLREYCTENAPETLFADGFDDAIIGLANVFNNYIVVYDRAKCIEIIVERDGLTFEEAEEFFSYNVTGAYVGDFTPAFFEPIDRIIELI